MNLSIVQIVRNLWKNMKIFNRFFWKLPQRISSNCTLLFHTKLKLKLIHPFEHASIKLTRTLLSSSSEYLQIICCGITNIFTSQYIYDVCGTLQIEDKDFFDSLELIFKNNFSRVSVLKTSDSLSNSQYTFWSFITHMMKLDKVNHRTWTRK